MGGGETGCGGELTPFGDRVGHGHRGGTTETGRLRHALADHPPAEHEHRVAGRDPRPLRCLERHRHGLDTGPPLERERTERDDAGGRHDHGLCKRTLDLRCHPDDLQPRALVLRGMAARPVTGQRRVERDAVTDDEAVDARSQRLDPAARLMSHHHPRYPAPRLSGIAVQIGPADPDMGQPQANLPRPGFGARPRLEM